VGVGSAVCVSGLRLSVVVGEGVATREREELSFNVLVRELDVSLEADGELERDATSVSVLDGVATMVMVAVSIRVAVGDRRREKVLCRLQTHPVPLPSLPLRHCPPSTAQACAMLPPAGWLVTQLQYVTHVPPPLSVAPA
jgi:hypothetical protein